MALPGGLTTFTLTFGSWTDVVGASAATTATGAPITGKLFPVDPSTNKRIRLTHITTGSVIVPANVPVLVAADGTGSVGPLPHTGQAALSPNGYALRLEWDLSSNFPGRPQDLTFVVTSGATADFDLLVPAATVPAVAISQPTVASVNAKTGAVVLTAGDVGAATPADLTAGLAGKADLSGGTVPESQIPARLSDVSLRAELVPGESFHSINTGASISRVIGDSDIPVGVGQANAAIIRLTEPARQLLIVVNQGSESLSIVEAAQGATAAPATGYSSVPVGFEYATASTAPVFAYFPTTAGTVRVYCEQGA